jgi:tetratricopeptide (TPR) repeat protein
MNIVKKSPSQGEIDLLINFLNQNRIDEAESFIKNLINNSSSSALLYNFYGIICSKKNNINDSVDAFKNAINLEKNFIDAYFNLGVILKDISVEESINNFKKVVELDKRNINALSHLGTIYAAKKNFLEAKYFFEKVVIINPLLADAQNNLGNVLFELGLFDLAKEAYYKAISLNKNLPSAYNNLARLFKEQNLNNEAIVAINKAILLNPNYFEAYSNLSIIFNEQERFEESINLCLRSIKINSQYADAYCNLGDAYRGIRNFDLAIENHKKAIQLDQNYSEAYNGLGLDYFGLFEYQKAIDQYKIAININQNYYQAYSNLAQAYNEIQNFTLAKFFYEKSTLLKKDFKDGYFNTSMIYLLEDNFKKGWLLYDYRWTIKKPQTPKYDITQNYWDGNFLDGTLLVWSEQGVGDIILFGSMISELKDSAKEIIFETDKRLIDLFNRYFVQQNIKNIKVKEFISDKPSFYDKHIAIGSLGQFFRRDIEDFKKAPKKFFIPDKNRILFFNNEILKYEKKLKIGLSWKTGNIKEEYRNIPLKDMYPILSDKRVCFFNLQFGETKKEILDVIHNTSANFTSFENLDNFNNFEDLSALISNLDLVITIQNTTAHLCGALGKKTFLLLSKNHRWQWGLSHESSLWYPSIKLFRQQTFKVWDNIVDNIKDEINKLI